MLCNKHNIGLVGEFLVLFELTSKAAERVSMGFGEWGWLHIVYLRFCCRDGFLLFSKFMATVLTFLMFRHCDIAMESR